MIESKIHRLAFQDMPIRECAHFRSNVYSEEIRGSFLDHFDRWGWTETDDKASARLWSPITLKEGATKRCKESVESVTALVIDYDSGTSLAEATEPLSCSWAAYTTHSHTLEHPKFRLIIPLSRPVPAEEWPGFWREAVGDIAPKADQACKDVSRIFYVPSRRHGLAWGDWWEAYSSDDDRGSEHVHEWVNPRTGEVDTWKTYERPPMDPSVYLLAAQHRAQMEGIRRAAAIVPTVSVTAGQGKDWATFDPRAWASALGLKMLEGTSRLWVECPWSSSHSDPSKDTIKDAYFRLDELPHWFGCSHSHCAGKKLPNIMREMRGEEFCK